MKNTLIGKKFNPQDVFTDEVDVFTVKEVAQEKIVDGRVTAVRFKDGSTAKVVDNCPINFVEYK